MKKKKYLIAFSLAIFSGCLFYEHRIVELKIPVADGSDLSIRVPWIDKQRLTYLFYNMFILDSGGYTLFECKPMYMNCYKKPFSIASGFYPFLESISPGNIKKYQGWKTWEKYAYLLENSPFFLWAEVNPFWTEPHDVMSILLIHKKLIDKTICCHNDDFKTVLSRSDVESHVLLQEGKEQPFLKSVLKRHDGLIGTIFGYGRNNAWMFEERNQGKQTSLAPIWDEEIYEFLCNRPITMCLEDLSLVLGYPTFLADPNTDETLALKKEFMLTRDRILEYYKGKDFLEATFRLLLEGPPKDY